MWNFNNQYQITEIFLQPRSFLLTALNSLLLPVPLEKVQFEAFHHGKWNRNIFIVESLL